MNYMNQGYYPPEYLPGPVPMVGEETEESFLRQITTRARITVPNIALQTIRNLWELYNYMVYVLDYPAFKNTGWQKTFEEMVITSGQSKMVVTAFLVGMDEVQRGIVPQDSVMDRLKMGAEAIAQAPAELIKTIVDPLVGSEGITRTLKYGAIIAGSAVALFFGWKLFSALGKG